MVGERVIAYAREALKRGHSVEKIVQSLTDAGHDRNVIQELVRRAVRERLSELEAQKSFFVDAPYMKAGRR